MTAKAPRPGVGARKEATEAAQQILVIRIGKDKWRLAWRDVPFGERMLVRKWTGLSLTAFVGSGETIDQDSIALLWCLARRAEGETSLVFGDALVDEYEAAVEAANGDIDIEIETPDEDDNPEA